MEKINQIFLPKYFERQSSFKENKIAIKNSTSIMKDEILSNLDNPAQLERLYRADKTFKRVLSKYFNETLKTIYNL